MGLSLTNNSFAGNLDPFIAVHSGELERGRVGQHILSTLAGRKLIRSRENISVRHSQGIGSRSVLNSGATSLEGPGSLVHLGSLKCIHPHGGGNSVSEGNRLVIYAGCNEERCGCALYHTCRARHRGNTLFCRAVTSILSQRLLHEMTNSRAVFIARILTLVERQNLAKQLNT